MANVFKLALRRLRQQDEFRTCLGYTASKKLFLTGSKWFKFVQCAKPTRQEWKLRILGCEATLSHQQEATPWLTFFLRFPLSRCTAFIRCTSRSTKVCCAASRERMTRTDLSPWVGKTRKINSTSIGGPFPSSSKAANFKTKQDWNRLVILTEK